MKAIRVKRLLLYGATLIIFYSCTEDTNYTDTSLKTSSPSSSPTTIPPLIKQTHPQDQTQMQVLTFT